MYYTAVETYSVEASKESYQVEDEGDSGRTKELDEGTGQSQWGQDETERDNIKLIKGKVCPYV